MATVLSTVGLPVATEPWDHQRDAFDAARERNGFLLAIPMGGGKGLVAVALAEHRQAQRILIVCPRSVVGVWQPQFEEHGLRTYHVWNGDVQGARGRLRSPSVARRAEALVHAYSGALRLERPFVAVVNFEATWQGQMAAATLGTPWDLIVIDESHRIKSPSGRVSKHIARIGERVRGRDGAVLAMTGTPMPHSPLDLWGQMRAIDGGERLGTNYQRFCHRFGAGEQIWAAGGVQRTVFKDVRPDAIDDLTRRVAPVMFQMDADELDQKLGLPPTTDEYRYCELQPATRKLYDQLEKHLIADVQGGVVTAANAMVLVLRLAQVTSGCAPVIPIGPAPLEAPEASALLERAEHRALVDPPEKSRLLGDVLEDFDQREPVVVFARFHADLDAIRAVAESQGRRYGELSGRRRDGLTHDSKMSADIEVLGAQLKSGGVGIDLTRARYAVYYSLDFALGDHLQSRKRVHRPGQTRRTTYIHLLARGTVDEAVFGALRKRQAVIDAVIDRLKGATP